MRQVAAAMAAMLATAAMAQETLSNASIEGLVTAGLGVDTVAAKVRSSPSRYDVSTDGLIDLKKHNVPDAVIAAMIDASSRSNVSARAIGASNSGDPQAPHASGVYLLAADAERMTRIDATSSQQTKTGGFLGYAFSGGIAKIKINAVVPGQHARVVSPHSRPDFYFYFDQANASLSSGGFWLAGAPVTSPSEFSLVRFTEKSDHREAAVGSFNIGGAKAGVQDKQRVAFSYSDVAPGVFKVTPSGDLAPGEYGFIYSSSSGGGVGMYGAGATTSRIFDFSVVVPPKA